jgi:hypothetical protein
MIFFIFDECGKSVKELDFYRENNGFCSMIQRMVGPLFMKEAVNEEIAGESFL